MVVIGLVSMYVLFGDTRSTNSIAITLEKSAAIQYKSWPLWKYIDPKYKRIRMLWILHDYVPFVNAGSEICAHTINSYFMRKSEKFDIYVASPGYPQRIFEGVRCFDLHDTKTLEYVLRLTDIFHSHSYVYRKQMIWLSKRTGKPFVEWVHTDNYIRSIKKDWSDINLVGRQWTVFNSDNLRKMVPELSDEYTRIFYPIVNYRTYWIDPIYRKPKYVTLSNVNENKGGKILIQLAKALPEMNFLGIIGGYRKQIMTNSLPNLKYIQHTTEMKDIYSQTWVQIMPSKEETWGRTAVEAMSSGIPVIASPTPGLRECCGNAAIYCERNDLDAWVKALKRLRNNEIYYNHMSQLALKRSRALDPYPGLAKMEHWIENSVYPSADTKNGRTITSMEKNLLFR
jgi:glycosyltransferase involved in cell wall biosynthesis